MDHCESWVPQGSTLILVLFLIYSNDLSENLASNSIFLLKTASVKEQTISRFLTFDVMTLLDEDSLEILFRQLNQTITSQLN